MGTLILPSVGRIYVDTNTVIYRVEQSEPYRSASAPVWDAVDQGTAVVVTSELTLLEVLVEPLRDGNLMLAALYREVLLDSRLECLAIDRPTLEEAARLKAEYRLRTPDAIHAATALRAGSVMFLTNDIDFRKVPGLNVVILGDVAAS